MPGVCLLSEYRSCQVSNKYYKYVYVYLGTYTYMKIKYEPYEVHKYA